MGVQAGAELVHQVDRLREAFLRAVHEVFEPDPRAHATVGRDCMRLQEPAVRLDGLEEVEALLVGDVRNERGPQPELGRDVGGALHEPPHVHHRRRARQQPLGITLQ